MSALVFRRFGWGLMAVLAIGVAAYFASPYLLFNPALSRLGLNPAIPIHFTILALHAGLAGLALLVGPFQFLSVVRARYPLVHRITGRVYVICVFVGSIAAFFSAIFSVSGFVAQLGFGILAVIWCYSICQAYLAIRRGQIQLHRVWMTRNYALTFAAVALRLWLGVWIGYAVLITHTAPQVGPNSIVYTSAAWISWVSTLMIAEWFINQRLFRTFLVKRERVSSRVQVES